MSVTNTLDVSDACFHGTISRVEAERRLWTNGAPNGHFLLRESESRKGRLCLSVWYEYRFSHILVPVTPQGDFYIGCDSHAFRSMTDLLRYYQTTSKIILSDRGTAAVLRVACPAIPTVPPTPTTPTSEAPVIASPASTRSGSSTGSQSQLRCTHCLQHIVESLDSPRYDAAPFGTNNSSHSEDNVAAKANLDGVSFASCSARRRTEADYINTKEITAANRGGGHGKSDLLLASPCSTDSACPMFDVSLDSASPTSANSEVLDPHISDPGPLPVFADDSGSPRRSGLRFFGQKLSRSLIDGPQESARRMWRRLSECGTKSTHEYTKMPEQPQRFSRQRSAPHGKHSTGNWPLHEERHNMAHRHRDGVCHQGHNHLHHTLSAPLHVSRPGPVSSKSEADTMRARDMIAILEAL